MNEKRIFSKELGVKPFRPDLPQVYIRELKDGNYEIIDAVVAYNFDVSYGRTEFALLLLQDCGGQQFVTYSSNEKITSIIGGALEKRARQRKASPFLGILGTVWPHVAITTKRHYKKMYV